MRKWTIAAAALLVLALAAPSNAAMDEGDWQVTFGGAFFFSEVHDNYGVDIALGYFVTVEIEIGVWFGWHYQNLDVTIKGEDDGEPWEEKFELTKTWWEFAAFVKYYFMMDGDWYPYVGGFVGYESARLETDEPGSSDDGDLDRAGFMLGGLLGVEYFISAKTKIFFQYMLIWRAEEEWDHDDSNGVVDDEQIAHRFSMGIGFLFN